MSHRWSYYLQGNTRLRIPLLVEHIFYLLTPNLSVFLMLCRSAGTALTPLSHQSTFAAIFATGHKKMCVCGKSQPCSARNTEPRGCSDLKLLPRRLRRTPTHNAAQPKTSLQKQLELRVYLKKKKKTCCETMNSCLFLLLLLFSLLFIIILSHATMTHGDRNANKRSDRFCVCGCFFSVSGIQICAIY